MDILYTYPRRLQYRFKRKRTVAPVSWPCQNKRSSLSNVMTYSYMTNATNEPVSGLVPCPILAERTGNGHRTVISDNPKGPMYVSV